MFIAIRSKVWHSHSVLIAQRRHSETPHPIRSASHAGHSARLPTREEWLLDSWRIAPTRLVFPVTGLPGYGTHSSQKKTLWSVAEYADTSGNSQKSGVRLPSRRVRLFPDLNLLHRWRKKRVTSSTQKAGPENPAGVAALRDGGVAPKQKIPQETRSETLFADSPVMHTVTMHAGWPVA